MNEQEVRDEYLLALADLFEKGNPHLVLNWRHAAKGEGIPEDTASKVIAQLKSEQAIVDQGGNINFTPSGYQQCLARIRALRELRGGKQ